MQIAAIVVLSTFGVLTVAMVYGVILMSCEEDDWEEERDDGDE